MAAFVYSRISVRPARRAWSSVNASNRAPTPPPRTAGLIAINLREDDEVIGAALVSPDEDLLLVSKGAQAIRFHADDEQMRPTGRATSGVIGMRFNEGDELLGMYVVREAEDVLVATEGGYAKRTPADQYPGPWRHHGTDRRGPGWPGGRADGPSGR